MRITLSAKTVIDKAFRHFLNERKSSNFLTREDLTRFAESCVTSKSVQQEIARLPDEYIRRHAFPSPETIQDVIRNPMSSGPILPQTKAIIAANINKPVNVASKPKVEPKTKQILGAQKDKVSFILRLKSDDIHKLRLLAAEENRSANMYVSQLIKTHLAKFDFGVLSL